MAIGMSYNDYWYGDVWLAVEYSKAYRFKKEEENERLWRQGLYFYDALSVSLTNIAKGLSGKTGGKKAEYPTKPYKIFEDKEKTKKEMEQEVENERLKAELFLRNWAREAAKKF